MCRRLPVGVRNFPSSADPWERSYGEASCIRVIGAGFTILSNEENTKQEKLTPTFTKLYAFLTRFIIVETYYHTFEGMKKYNHLLIGLFQLSVPCSLRNAFVSLKQLNSYFL